MQTIYKKLSDHIKQPNLFGTLHPQIQLIQVYKYNYKFCQVVKGLNPVRVTTSRLHCQVYKLIAIVMLQQLQTIRIGCNLKKQSRDSKPLQLWQLQPKFDQQTLQYSAWGTSTH